MHATMSPRAHRLWAQYWLEESWGPSRDNAHAGIIAAMLVNVQRWKQKHPAGTDAHFRDFMLLDHDAKKEVDTAESLKNLMAMAKRVPRKRKPKNPDKKRKGK